MKHVVLLKSRAGNHGGLEKYAARIVSAFIERGAKVSVLTTGAPGDVLQTSAAIVYPFQTIPWPAFLRMEQFDQFVQNWLKENQADLVFGMDRNRTQTHIRAGNGVHAAFLESRIFTEGHLKHLLCHFNPLHRKILALEKAAFENRSLQKLFTNSHMVRNQILERYAVAPNKIQVIHNGVEWREMESDFSSWENSRAQCTRLGLDPNCFQFLFIGNGYLRKGLDCLLEALSRLSFKDFQLSVIGKDNQLDFYRAKSAALGLERKVFFFGPSQESRLFYQLADVLVIPSFYDPFANVTVEALAMGLYVISSKHNGGHEILTEQNGLTIENLLDPDATLKALEIALKHRKTKASAVAARCSVEYLDFSHQMRVLMDAL